MCQWVGVTRSDGHRDADVDVDVDVTESYTTILGSLVVTGSMIRCRPPPLG